nr:MAG TPA: hypothetical protein [Caudoviricetes sp.]
MGNTGKNEDYVGEVMPNSDRGKLLIVQYNQSDGGRESWLTVAGECGQNGKDGHLQPILIVRGAKADEIYRLLTDKNAK